MDLKIKFEDNLKLKFLVLVILYLIFFYFFIFKNIRDYIELQGYIDNEQIKIQKLTLENTELKNSLTSKKEDFEKELLLLEKKKENKDDKLVFPKISDAFELIDKYMVKNNIIFESFGRSQKNGNMKTISFTFRASEEDSINFFKDLENSEYYFKLSDSYFSLSTSNVQILSRVSIKIKINENFEKTAIDNKLSENIFFKSQKKDKNSSYMRIGNNKFYRTNNYGNENNSSKESKTLKKD